MTQLHIQGGAPLVGRVSAAGSKNAALPIMAASILASQPVTLLRAPWVADVHLLSRVLQELDVLVERLPDGAMQLTSPENGKTKASFPLVRRMRASFCVLGPLLARRGQARVALPGGCNLGRRPVDLHLAGLAALGADLSLRRGYVVARARGLRGADIDLTGPCGPTVTGTANVLSAAVLARGKTRLRGAAREPEIVALGAFLNQLGARVAGLGTSTLEITGVDQLGGGSFRIIPDRIEAATLLVACAATRGRITLRDACPNHLSAVLELLEAVGAEIELEGTSITLTMQRRPRAARVAATPYPGVPTDLQPQLTALLSVADGGSLIHDAVFPERFSHVGELNRMGAKIERDGATASLRGVDRLKGATVSATDLRGGAALVVAGLAADGQTTVRQTHHLDRGYERLEEKLRSLGGHVHRSPETSNTAATDGARSGELPAATSR